MTWTPSNTCFELLPEAVDSTGLDDVGCGERGSTEHGDEGYGDDVESLGCLNSAGMIIREQLVAVVHVQYL